MTLTSKSLTVLILVILFGGIAFSSAMGWWQTESTKTPATYTDGDFAGQSNPADIRGSYTLGDVEKNFNIPAALLAEAFGITTADPFAFAVKELEASYADSPVEIGTASIRLFVAFYNGLPIDLSTDMYLPQSAADILLERGTLTPEQLTYLEAHTAPSAESAAPPATPIIAPAAAPEATEHAQSTERIIKGKTTFQELLDWGVTQETMKKVMGVAMPAPGIKIKDFCTAQGLSFETLKTQLQTEVDKVK